MAICRKFGKQLEDNVKFCPGCGTSIEASDKTDISSKIASLNNSPDTTSDFDSKDVAQNKAMAILAYFGPLVLIPNHQYNQSCILGIPCAGYYRYCQCSRRQS